VVFNFSVAERGLYPDGGARPQYGELTARIPVRRQRTVAVPWQGKDCPRRGCGILGRRDPYREFRRCGVGGTRSAGTGPDRSVRGRFEISRRNRATWGGAEASVKSTDVDHEPADRTAAAEADAKGPRPNAGRTGPEGWAGDMIDVADLAARGRDLHRFAGVRAQRLQKGVLRRRRIACCK
jgi:hypothetical protein